LSSEIERTTNRLKKKLIESELLFSQLALLLGINTQIDELLMCITLIEKKKKKEGNVVALSFTLFSHEVK
jgi:hypothetical protein